MHLKNAYKDEMGGLGRGTECSSTLSCSVGCNMSLVLVRVEAVALVVD